MAAPPLDDEKDASSGEDRFARQDFNRYSHWSSAVAIIAILIAIAAVFIYFAILQAHANVSAPLATLAPTERC
jgi:uncharacterized membrane protein